MYMRGTSASCSDEKSFTVTITSKPVVPAVQNVTNCGPYTLPAAPAGTNYFSSTGGVGPIAAGTVISANQTIYVYAEHFCQLL
ncbi:MAG: hypothetical protein WKG07_01330 [Hymenobacter sp.]